MEMAMSGITAQLSTGLAILSARDKGKELAVIDVGGGRMAVSGITAQLSTGLAILSARDKGKELAVIDVGGGRVRSDRWDESRAKFCLWDESRATAGTSPRAHGAPPPRPTTRTCRRR
uniref:Uncharacterized protein n=1 Tax=Oryza meridionalis TaxID=40149 RepID=A0A0E0E9P4_9ORYZ